MQRVLIVGGTQDAAHLATQLLTLPGLEVISSLAGRLRQPVAPPGTSRVGGFGGVQGLIDYLQVQHIDLLIDATHPFAAQISWHAASAAQACGLPHLMLVRPAWTPEPGDHWIAVESLAAAAARLPALAQRVFLTIGRQELAAFAHLTELWFLMRMIDPPTPETPVPPGTVILERGPFTVPDELTLLRTHAIDAIVSKNSGGRATYAKLLAARTLHLPVLLVQRPPLPAGEQVTDVAQAYRWVAQHLEHR
ncbi:MAG: cobalt-precorrin-6A reductase [Candidatus Tectimicrobiota bacterium]